MFRSESESESGNVSENESSDESSYESQLRTLFTITDMRVGYYLHLSRSIVEAATGFASEEKKDQFYLAIAKKYNILDNINELNQLNDQLVRSFKLCADDYEYMPNECISMFESKQKLVSDHYVETMRNFYLIRDAVAQADVRSISREIEGAENVPTVSFSLESSECGNINRLFAKLSAERKAAQALMQDIEDKSYDFGATLS